jgi:flavin-dependent dehydrogenase
MKTAEVPRRSALDQDAQADVCVVGAGIAGLTTGYLLARAMQTGGGAGRHIRERDPRFQLPPCGSARLPAVLPLE